MQPPMAPNEFDHPIRYFYSFIRERYLLFGITFLSCLRLMLGLVKYSSNIRMFADMLAYSAPMMLGFTVLLLTFVMTFAIGGW